MALKDNIYTGISVSKYTLYDVYALLGAPVSNNKRPIKWCKWTNGKATFNILNHIRASCLWDYEENEMKKNVFNSVHICINTCGIDADAIRGRSSFYILLPACHIIDTIFLLNLWMAIIPWKEIAHLFNASATMQLFINGIVAKSALSMSYHSRNINYFIEQAYAIASVSLWFNKCAKYIIYGRIIIIFGRIALRIEHFRFFYQCGAV